MAGFEDTLARMKGLYTYGKELNEGTKMSSYSIEHSAVAADGKTYGIIRECNKYYIKKAQSGKETIAEGYDYIGGYCNKGNYEYDSYSKAIKNFELKMASINEACEGKVNIETLDPFKKGEFIVEGTERMKNEIARQRQIMHNTAMLMNEASEIGATRKDDVVMYDGKNPEAETGKQGDEEYKETNANPEYAGSKKAFNPEAAPFEEKPVQGEDQLKESCECGECDWASKGLPSTPGVGEADTDHNNDPFTQTVNEGEEELEFDVESDDVEDDVMNSEDELDSEDMGFESEEGDDDFNVEDFDDQEEIEDIDTETEGEEDDIMSRIAALESELEALRAEVNGENGLEPEEEFSSEDDELGAEEEGDEFYAEEEPDFNGEMSDFENEFNDAENDEYDEEGSFDEDLDECGSVDALMEVKQNYMNNIINSVVNSILNEDKLNVWGKHPGYRKKPMELPTTGEDKNQWGEDWNDESVHSEEPFGSKIGSSSPFDQVVDAITKDVMSQLAGDAFKKKA